MKLKIILDIDDVVADWVPTFCKHYNNPIPTTWVNPYVTRERLNELAKNKTYWINLPIRHRPNFKPKGYLSARSIPKSWTHQFMQKNQLPGRSNIHQVPWNTSKIEKLKFLKSDVFIDDKDETFLECHNHNLCCLLMDAPWNQHINTIYRIYDLDYDTITAKYNLWLSNLSQNP